jgi:hypothetical protein
MRFLLNVSAAIVLLIGFLSPKYGELFSPQVMAMVLLGAAIFISIGIGTFWFTTIKKTMANSAFADVHKTTDALLKPQNLWLQGVRPIASANQVVSSSDARSSMNAIRHRFMSSFLLGIWALGIGGVAMLIFEGASSSRGLFGALLQSPEGKGAAIAFGLYLGISSLAFFTIGFLAFVNKRGQ